MALKREVWIDQVKEGFYPDDSFLQKATDYSQFVDHNRLHIASAGIDPKVLVNNTTYPISVIGRDDEDNEIRLDKFETENTIHAAREICEVAAKLWVVYLLISLVRTIALETNDLSR